MYVYIVYHYEECDGRWVSDVCAVYKSESAAKKAVEEYVAEASDDSFGYEERYVSE